MNCSWNLVLWILAHYMLGTDSDVTSCRYYESRKEMDCSFIDVGDLKGQKYPLNKTETVTLNLKSSKLRKLDFDAFEVLLNLEYLSLAENLLDNLDYRLFSNLRSLTVLNLASNRLTNLHPRLFVNVTELKKLYLENNVITHITISRTFSAQTKLYYLTLKNNNIRTINGRVLMSLMSLIRLDLSGNPLNCDCRLRLAMLVCLKKCLETGAICQSPSLYNGQSWTQLKNRNNCNDTYTSYETFGTNPKGGDVSEICKNKRCHHETVSRFVDCTEVKLEKVSKGKYPLADRQLASISLRNTGLKELECDTFTEVTELHSLDLGQNALSNIDINLFADLSKLTLLYLDNNLLSTLSDGNIFLSQANLDLMSLASNKLTYISEEVLQPLKSLKTLGLQGNPFICDCKLSPALHWCETKNISTGATCKHPKGYSGSSWDILGNGTDSCSKIIPDKLDIILIVISVCIALTAACSAFIAFWFFWKRTRLQNSSENAIVTYDDVRSGDYQYYEAINVSGTSTECCPMPPVLPKRPTLTVGDGRIYDDVGNSRASEETSSYIVPTNIPTC